MGDHPPNCSYCFDQCAKMNLCSDCKWDRTCCYCGTEMPFLGGGGDNMQMCEPCKQKLDKEYVERQCLQ